MTNPAKNIPCALQMYPENEKYRESIRNFQGCPTVATTKNGRIFLGWYSGGTTEPHMENYNLLIKSDDGGKTWSKPILVIPSDKNQLIHALDIQLWTAPDGALYVFWVQNNVRYLPTNVRPPRPDWVKANQPWTWNENYEFFDFDHAMWVSVCENPDADVLEFSAPRYLDKGFLRCKPLVLKSGRWLLFNYDQNTERYGYSISDDAGKTLTRHYGSQKLSTNFDEGMAYELQDGSVRMLARNNLGALTECFSHDGGSSWSEAALSDIVSADTRFYIARTPTGRLLLVHNNCPDIRTNMTVSLSEDDGVTWKYSQCIDTRESLSYPDADFYDGKIYLTYDRERTGAKEILFAVFTEEDLINGNKIETTIVSKP